MTTLSDFGHGHGYEAVSKDGAPSAHSAPKSFFCEIGSSKISSQWLRRPRAEHISLMKASIQPDSIEFSIKQTPNCINQFGPQGLVTSAQVKSTSSDQYPAVVSHMGGNASAQKLCCGSKHNGSYISTEECAQGNAPEELKILGRSLRPSPLSSLRPRKPRYLTHFNQSESTIFHLQFIFQGQFLFQPLCVIV